ncbi:exo-alpha-sialidase [Bacteroidota bacterium]
MTAHNFKIFIGLIIISIHVLFQFSLNAQETLKDSNESQLKSEFIFPFQDLHVHSSSIVALSNGDLLCCWFEGSGERTANDVVIKGARLKKGNNEWSTPFIMADTPGHPDCNPVLFLDKENRLFLFWIVVQANRWEVSILKWRMSSEYLKDVIPKWEWQDIILLKPDDAFAETIKNEFMGSNPPAQAWAEYAPLYEKMIFEAAQDPKKRETGWMTRTHPIQLPGGRILLPLYSDGFNLSLMAISNDNGKTWKPGLPLVDRGNVQPSVVQRKDGTLVAYMRDNGDEPGRIMKSFSQDDGISWSNVEDTDLPNPGASIEAIALKEGNWLIVYNDVESGRHSLAVSLSDDEGETWKWKWHLEKEDPGEGSFSYPSVIQSLDGLIHITYSFHLKDKKTIKYVFFSSDWIKEKD